MEKRVGTMKKGDTLTPKVGDGYFLITDDPKPPKMWTIKDQTGKEKHRRKSHLKKYYEVDVNVENTG